MSLASFCQSRARYGRPTFCRNNFVCLMLIKLFDRWSLVGYTCMYRKCPPPPPMLNEYFRLGERKLFGQAAKKWFLLMIAASLFCTLQCPWIIIIIIRHLYCAVPLLIYSTAHYIITDIITPALAELPMGAHKH